MRLFLRQVWALTLKNLLIALVRPLFSTIVRAFLLPIIFIVFISYARNLFVIPSTYGIGQPTPVRSLTDALDFVTGGRNKLIFVNNGFTDGDIAHVIDQVAQPVKTNGIQVDILSSETELHNICRSSLRGVSTCIGAAVFYSSPNEGPGGQWNYSIRADGALGIKIDVGKSTNDEQIYLLPLQHSIDWAIARLNSTVDQNALPDQVLQYPFTSMTQHQRDVEIRTRYMSGIIDILAVAIFIGMVGVTYQLTGVVAMEREIGISQLIDCMMPNASRWQPRAGRFIAAHLAFDLIYGPAWIITAVILKRGVYSQTSAGVTIIFHLLTGLSLSSFSLLIAAFFKKAQLSGITAVIASLLLGVVAQVTGIKSNGSVVVLSLLFPPMNYVFFSIFMARWQKQNLPTNLVQAAPGSPWTIPGIAFWVLLIVQIFAFPVLAALVERVLYGTVSKGRSASRLDGNSAMKLEGFTKLYRPNWFHRNVASIFGGQRQSVLAVNNLSLDVVKGEIMVLLGANGSGKSTTLDAISGLNKVTSGEIKLYSDEHGVRFGLCPQKNVLWDSLTVREHVKIFNRLKATGTVDNNERISKLIEDCDLGKKLKARSKTLSGGQKRKLQLAMMFTGGSTICCVDEVSSGLDPISRRKIWDILLAERGTRTILLTTHFLDEAELLADHIAILAKGDLKAQGSSVELKHRLGSGYRVHVFNVPQSADVAKLEFAGISKEVHFDETVYNVQTSADAAELVSMLEDEGIPEYRVSGPTIEDVFLKVAKDSGFNADDSSDLGADLTQEEAKFDGEEKSRNVKQPSLQLVTGKRIGMVRQAWVLFRKRATILRRNWFPYAAAFLIPLIAAGLVTLFLKGTTRAGCSGPSTFSTSQVSGLDYLQYLDIVVGPSNKVSLSDLSRFASAFPGGATGAGSINITALQNDFHLVNSLPEFNNYIANNFANVTPGGFYLGDSSSPPTFAWNGDNGAFPLAAITQNALDIFLTNVTIGFDFQYFDIPWQPNAGNTLQLITYFGLAMSVYPAMFALYPTVERLRNVRALHYSNGVRALPLWLAYAAFDFCIVLAASVLAIIVLRAASDIWYYPGYLFVVFFLYGLASTMLSYVISLVAKSQLAAFAFSAGGQCVMFLLYFIAYMAILTYAPVNKIDSYVNIAHFTIGAITPSGNLIRAFFVALNVFSILCRGREVATYPGQITLYGGPILYLTLQSLGLFGLLLWLDGGPKFSSLRMRKHRADELEEKMTVDTDISDELTRVASSNDGLRVLHLTKKFGKNVAVEDVTFGVSRGEVFALLGPNGAGKTTTITMIRGDMQPTLKGGEIFVENVSVLKNRATARSHLGVCPQFDAMDQMTVMEHLKFYARIRGVSDIDHNVGEVLRAVGLTPFKRRMGVKLSGGNKRKLSLGIALMGNPTVLLLDEPSSGMDAASKRIMWKTLAAVVPGRSIVLTTHSMEEADALANRAGIMAKRMLALGTTDYLRRKYGNMYHVHLVHAQAPHTSDGDMEHIRSWVLETFPAAVIEQKTYHGQLRFSVPSSLRGATEIKEDGDEETSIEHITDEIQPEKSSIGNLTLDHQRTHCSASKLFSSLEQNKSALGVQFYSVSQTSLDQVFLTIVGQHNVQEENEA